MGLSPLQIRYIIQGAALLLMCLHISVLRVRHKGPGIFLWVSLAILAAFFVSYALRMIVYLSYRRTPEKNADLAQTRWDTLNYYGFLFFTFAIYYFLLFTFNVITIVLYFAAMVFIFPASLLLDGLLDRRGTATVSDIQAAVTYCQAAYSGAFVGNEKTRTKYVVLQESNSLQLHVDQNVLIVAFAGTRLKESATIRTDLDLLSATYGPDLVTDGDALSLVGRGLGAHKGFFDAYMSVRSNLQQTVKQAVSGNVNKILVTGHSLGGALASLCVFDLACNTSYLGLKDRSALSLITFGSPALASNGLQSAFDTLVPKSTRVYHVNDPIVYIAAWQFQHLGHSFVCHTAMFSIFSHFTGSYSDAVSASANIRKRYIIATSISGAMVVLCSLAILCYRWWALATGRTDYLDVKNWKRRPEITKKSLFVYDR